VNDGSTVTRCADPNAASLARVQKLFPDVAVHTDYRELLAKDDVDAVVIAVPTDLHVDVAREALEAGKHVLCEKPLTHRGSDARALAALAADRKRILMVGHVFMFNSGVRYMRQAVADGVVGEVYSLRAARTNLGPIRSDVNAAWDLATHDISIFNYVLGRRPVSVVATGSRCLQKSIEDIVFIVLDYGHDLHAAITASWLDPRKVRQISLVGSEKMITWDDMAISGSISVYDRRVVQEPYYDNFEQFRLLTHEGDVTIPRLKGGEPLGGEAAHFIACCRSGSIDLCSATEGAEVVEILEAVDRSLAAGGNRVTVEYGD
jgi:predicted dehydrogenase